MRRGKWIILAALPVVLILGDYVFWRMALLRLDSGFAAWRQQAEAAGWTVRHDPPRPGGWPGTAALRIENFTVTAISPRGVPRGIVAGWTSGALVLRIHLTQPDVVEVTPIGPHTIRLAGGPPVAISGGPIALRFPLRLSGPPRDFALEAEALEAVIPGSGTVHIASISAWAEVNDPERRDQPAASFSARADGIVLPDALRVGPDAPVDAVAMEGVVNGALRDGGDMAARVRAWRDEGGSVELHRLAVTWGQARMEATATLALDEDVQPMGTGTAKIAGYEPVLDRLAAKGVLSRSAVRAAKAMLTLLADTPAEGQPAEVEVPLTLQFRTLSVSQIPLARLPEVSWPSP